jgi:glycosyltransferase involved in cell wall biosynthesis
MTEIRRTRRTVVLVCMADSIHTARWIGQFVDQPVDFVVFPSTPNRRVHPLIVDWVSGGQDMTVRVVPFSGSLSIPLWGMDLILRDRMRGFLLRRVLRDIRPDYVHALELQHGGYITSRALDRLPDAPPFIATNWGSDIFWFQRYPAHLRRLRRMLAKADFYSAECQRDIDLASALGFAGTPLPVFPNAGGFSPSVLDKKVSEPSSRRVIAVKGYESFVGRASVALRAIEEVKDVLAGYQLVIFSANVKTQRLAAALAKRTGLDISWHAKKSLSHDKMMELFASARTYIGVSLSDGISTSLLESMVTGAFPVQTNTSCASEWITDGLSGFIVSPDDPESIGARLRRSITDDALVDSAASMNAVTARNRLDERIGQQNSFRFYALGSSSDINSA